VDSPTAFEELRAINKNHHKQVDMVLCDPEANASLKARANAMIAELDRGDC